MGKFGEVLINAAIKESNAKFELLEPIIYNSYTKEILPYSSYISNTNPEDFYVEGIGYKLSDSCGNEIYTTDKIRCCLYYDKAHLLSYGHTIEVIEEPLRFVRKMADEKFMEIWDDEESKKEIDDLIAFASYLADEIERLQILK